jgi:hypothetical protein
VATTTINIPAIHASAPPPPPDDDDPAATTRLGDADGDVVGGVEGLTLFDTRGDGLTEDVGVGDTGTTGLAVAVAVGLIRECVGVGVGVEELVVPITVIVPCMLEWMLQWYANVPALLNVTE